MRHNYIQRYSQIQRFCCAYAHKFHKIDVVDNSESRDYLEHAHELHADVIHDDVARLYVAEDAL